jgi:competence protein ComEA
MTRTKNYFTAVVFALAASYAFCASAAENADKRVVNINTASVAELQLLPGIGAKTADSIVAYRAKRPFKKIDDLVRVKGIGRKTFKKLRPHLTVQGATTAKEKIKLIE